MKPDSGGTSQASRKHDGAPAPGAGGAHTPDGSGMTGRHLGQYEILEKIGQGGMGTVFRARDTALERTVALKVLSASALDDPKQCERFMREARSLARLSHPYLLHVYNVGSDQDCSYFAMELLAGETLHAAIRRCRRMPAPELIYYLGQILAALNYVHQNGITHRDIKSSNIMLCDRRAVLMDFGLMKDESLSGLTSMGVAVGTPDYMAPETAEGRNAGPPTDIYSLGIVMYEALAGRLPFSGLTALSLIRQHMDTPPPELRSLAPDVEPALAGIVHKCLEKKVSDRYAGCRALASALLEVYSTPELQTLVTPSAPSAARHSGAADRPAPVSGAAVQETMVDGSARRSPPAAASRDDALTVVSHPPLSATLTAITPQKTPPLQEASEPAESSRSVWLWAAAGFAGMLILFFALSRLIQKPPVRTGQPVIDHAANGSSRKSRWIEFKGGDPNPANWHHVIELQRADGTWERRKMSHAEFMRDSNGRTLEFVPPDGQESP